MTARMAVEWRRGPLLNGGKDGVPVLGDGNANEKKKLMGVG